MASKPAKGWLYASAAVIATLSGAQAAWAQVEQSVGLEEVVVTAERRTTDVQRTPLSIQAVSGEALTNQSVTNAFDLQRALPSLNVVQGTAYPNIYINGVGGGTSNLYGTPTVAFNLDGVPLGQAYGAGTAFYDLERVEVLKGPQGTLYGRNATAGALNIIPNTPKPYFEGAVGAQLGNYADREFTGMLNVPLNTAWAARVAFNTIHHDGYITNGTSDADSQSVRGNLQWKASDKVTLRFTGDYLKIGGKGPGDVPLYPGRSFTGRPPILPGFTGEYLDPGNKWTGFTPDVTYPTCTTPARCLIPAAGATPANSAPVNAGIPARLSLSGAPDIAQDVQQTQLAAHLDWDMDFATLTVIPAWVKTDASFINYNNMRRGTTVQHAKQHSIEARLTSNGQGPLTWVLGAYYYKQDLSASNLFFQEDIGYGGYVVPKLVDTSYALFGQTTYSISQTVRLTGGLRYTHQTGSQNGYAAAPAVATPAYIAANPSSGNPQGLIPSVGALKDDAVNYLARVEWDVRPRSMLYASITTGYKAGGFNPGTSQNTFPPETLTAYAVGAKNRFLENRLQVNIDGFYWDYRNQQVQQNYGVQPCPLTCFAFSVVPVTKSHIWGVEADVHWLVTDTLRLGLDVVRQEGIFDNYSTIAVPILNAPALTYNGNDRPFTPHWKGDISLEQTFRMADDSRLILGADTHLQTRQNLVNNINPAQPKGLYTQPGYMMSSATLTYQRAMWSVGAFINNIENRFVRQGFGVASMYGGASATPMAPRTYGVRVRAQFGGR